MGTAAATNVALRGLLSFSIIGKSLCTLVKITTIHLLVYSWGHPCLISQMRPLAHVKVHRVDDSALRALSVRMVHRLALPVRDQQGRSSEVAV